MSDIRLWRALAAAIAAAALFACGPASGEEYKIGVIHVERVLSQSPAAKAAHDKIQREFEARDRDIAARERDLREALTVYDRDKARLSSDERTTRERELDLRGREIERLRTKFAEDLHARQFEELDKLKETLDRVITRIAHEQHYDLILQGALFVGRSVDITDEVIRALGQ